MKDKVTSSVQGLGQCQVNLWVNHTGELNDKVEREPREPQEALETENSICLDSKPMRGER